MKKAYRKLTFSTLENRIALAACNGAFGMTVGGIANGSIDPATYGETGIEVPDGPANGDGTDGAVVGNIKSGTATGESTIWNEGPGDVARRIHTVRDAVVGEVCGD